MPPQGKPLCLRLLLYVMAKIHAATVIIRKRDGSVTLTVNNVVVTGDGIDAQKRNPVNLKRALYYGKPKGDKEDETRWVIVDVICYKILGETNHDNT